MNFRSGLLITLIVAALGCAGPEPDSADTRLVDYTEDREPCTDYRGTRRALFGDLHVHSAYSFDAAANSLETYPDHAHRFAKGEAIPFFPLDDDGNPVGTVALDRPLDFVSITDHGEFLGERALCRTPGSPKYDGEFCEQYRSSERQGMLMLGTIVNLEKPERLAMLCEKDGSLCREWAEGPWQEMIAAAEAAYDRSASCEFTSFIGYEYTGTPGLSNIHRNVIFRNSVVPAVPVSYIEAPNDRLLWDELQQSCPESDGCSWVTIPHNSNLSNGRMFRPLGGHHDHGNDAGTADKRAHAEARLAHEPVIEIFQHKGNSECINGLATIYGEPDELCNVEAVRHFGQTRSTARIGMHDGQLQTEYIVVTTEECGDETGGDGMLGGGCVDETDFLRSNLLTGLEDEHELGVNSAKLGVIGSTDTHASTPGATDEQNWGGHVSKEATPEERLQPGLLTSGIEGNPGGLAGVWAVENSRDAIFEALERREVFGTTGPRIEPRFFGGWDYAPQLCDAGDRLEQAYAGGVPMGGDFGPRPDGAAPVFLAMARADTVESAPLQRLQVIKGWLDDENRKRYKVYEVAGTADSDAGVDVSTGERFGAGHEELCTVFEDPDFDAAQPAFYYLRAVENPSPRWSLLDCLKIAAADRPAVCGEDSDVPKVIQEMAWSSPIWYRP
ncbi:MAG: DUF3604 domain-containing protein [Gammaproteobacteria bacterium]|nr:DUF3604 domain-containing protein [Gammaproteobacteria bacterium]MDH3373597.1 DUF3604 domain-containing protein [Gammaproteobacteria bacterium]MDH3409760.1 DUF3604 domain-containing protein [Gammaproteobacteria bacterium]